MERLSSLRTKVVLEKEEQREGRKHTLALQRVPRSPPGGCLFYSPERLPVLFPFVREALQNGLPFELRASGG